MSQAHDFTSLILLVFSYQVTISTIYDKIDSLLVSMKATQVFVKRLTPLG